MPAPPTSVTDTSPPPPQHQHSGIPKWIRTFAIPIIIGWIALVAVLSVVVPPLEVVGQMRSVSMSAQTAPSVIAMKQVGKVFDEFKSDSAVMIVLEGEQKLGADAHLFYNDMVARLEADTKHVEHVQDFWGVTRSPRRGGRRARTGRPPTCRSTSPATWARPWPTNRWKRPRSWSRRCHRRPVSRSS